MAEEPESEKEREEWFKPSTKHRHYGDYQCQECGNVAVEDSGDPTTNRWCRPCGKITRQKRRP